VDAPSHCLDNMFTSSNTYTAGSLLMFYSKWLQN